MTTQSVARNTPEIPRGRGLSQKTLILIDAAYTIAESRQPISVRGIAYQLFTMRLIPDMSANSTKRVSRIATIARERGLIPWAWIVDESREIDRPQTWSDLTRFSATVQNAYRKDRWATQPQRLLLMSEKGTVGGTLRPVLDDFGVPFLVVHGFSSATVVNDLADESNNDPRPLTILYVGDYDPSGLHMPLVDLPQRLARYGGIAKVERVALLEHHLPGLPSFSAKEKKRDTRYPWFAATYGDTCWELDALDQNTLRDSVQRAIEDYLDNEAWERAGVAEDAELRSLRDFFDTNVGIFGQVPE